jgi:DNA-binding MarR family transcriptional regulator
MTVSQGTMMYYSPEERDRYHFTIFHQLKNLFNIENLSGEEVFSSLNRIVQIAEIIDSRPSENCQTISGPRWRILLHLFLSEKIGKLNGLTPTELSLFQRVSKNTVSALLRGLEEHGYIVRELDVKDLRIFHIHLSETGRQLILETASERIQGFNQMISCLSEEEVSHLTLLLKKLHHSLENQFCHFQK